MHSKASSSPFSFDQLFYSFFSLPISKQAESSSIRVHLVSGTDQNHKTILHKKVLHSLWSNRFRMKAVSSKGHSEWIVLSRSDFDVQTKNQFRMQSKSVFGYSSWLHSNVIDQSDGDVLFQLLLDYLAFEAREMSLEAYLDAVMHQLYRLGAKDQYGHIFNVYELIDWLSMMTNETLDIQKLKVGFDQSRFTIQDAFELLVQLFLFDEIEKLIKKENRQITMKREDLLSIYFESTYLFKTKKESLMLGIEIERDSWFRSRFLDVLKAVFGIEELESFQIQHQESIFKDFMYRFSSLFTQAFRDDYTITSFIDLANRKYDPMVEKQYGYFLHELEQSVFFSFLSDQVKFSKNEFISSELISYGSSVFRKGYRLIVDEIRQLLIDKPYEESFLLSIQSAIFYFLSQKINPSERFVFSNDESYRLESKSLFFDELERFSLWEKAIRAFGKRIHQVDFLQMHAGIYSLHTKMRDVFRSVETWKSESIESFQFKKVEIMSWLDQITIADLEMMQLKMASFGIEMESVSIGSIEKLKSILIYIDKIIEQYALHASESFVVRHAMQELTHIFQFVRNEKITVDALDVKSIQAFFHLLQSENIKFILEHALAIEYLHLIYQETNQQWIGTTKVEKETFGTDVSAMIDYETIYVESFADEDSSISFEEKETIQKNMNQIIQMEFTWKAIEQLFFLKNEKKQNELLTLFLFEQKEFQLNPLFFTKMMEQWLLSFSTVIDLLFHVSQKIEQLHHHLVEKIEIPYGLTKPIENLHHHLIEQMKIKKLIFEPHDHSLIESNEQIKKRIWYYINDFQFVSFREKNDRYEFDQMDLYSESIHEQECIAFEILDYSYPIGLFQLGEHNLI